jgi:hypothetical protein
VVTVVAVMVAVSDMMWVEVVAGAGGRGESWRWWW